MRVGKKSLQYTILGEKPGLSIFNKMVGKAVKKIPNKRKAKPYCQPRCRIFIQTSVFGKGLKKVNCSANSVILILQQSGGKLF